MPNWNEGGASVTGSSHSATNTGCQDFWSCEKSLDGDWIALAVCDGAGSALHAEVGAEFVSKTFVEKLIELSSLLKKRAPGAWVSDYVIQEVINVRDALRGIAKTDDLSDYHTTLVACLQGPTGGFAMHIGDGIVLGGNKKGQQQPQDLFVSDPHNGEYSNETFFITERDWVKNLRISPMPPTDWIMLLSDGGSAIALNKDGSIDLDAMNLLVQDLRGSNPNEWNDVVKKWIGSEGFASRTSDDKTLLVAIKNYEKNEEYDFSGLKKKSATTSVGAANKSAGHIEKSPKNKFPVEKVVIPKKAKNVRPLLLVSVLVLLMGCAIGVYLYFAYGTAAVIETVKEAIPKVDVVQENMPKIQIELPAKKRSSTDI